MTTQKKEIKLRLPEKLQAGVYANSTMVSHNREEFIVDFLMVAPPVGTVVSRVILTPAHTQRLIATLQENLKRYEKTFGSVAPTETPSMKMGFSD